MQLGLRNPRKKLNKKTAAIVAAVIENYTRRVRQGIPTHSIACNLY